MADETQKDAPAKTAEETKPAAAPVADKSASNASLVKNLIFAIFIICAIIFCFKQLNRRSLLNELNRLTEMYNAAVEDEENVDYGQLREVANGYENLFGDKDPADVLANEDELLMVNAVWGDAYYRLQDDPEGSDAEKDELLRKAAGKGYDIDQTPLLIKRLNAKNLHVEAEGEPQVSEPIAEEAPAAEAPAPEAPAAEAPAAE